MCMECAYECICGSNYPDQLNEVTHPLNIFDLYKMFETFLCVRHMDLSR